MKELTERQAEVFDFICRYRADRGYSPSFSEIGKGVFMSKPNVARHINILVKKGYIEYTPKVCRSIVVHN